MGPSDIQPSIETSVNAHTNTPAAMPTVRLAEFERALTRDRPAVSLMISVYRSNDVWRWSGLFRSTAGT